MSAAIMGDALTTREAHVLRLRFGIDTEERTLEEIASLFGLSHQRVHQIEKAALEKLRNSPAAEKLREYWED